MGVTAAITLSPKRAFISYTHDDDAHRGRVLQLADSLNAHGVQCNLDQYEMALKNGDGAGWMEQQIRESDFILLVCSKEYCAAWEDTLPVDKRKGARWEILHVRNAVYCAGSKNDKFIPVLFTPSDECHIPLMLGTASRYVVADQSGYDNLYWRITGQHTVLTPPLGTVVEKPASVRPKPFAPPGSMATLDVSVDRKHLPIPVVLKLNKDFDSFTEADQDKVTKAIKQLMATGAEVRVKQKRRGCVELEYEIVGDDFAATRLNEAIANGALDDFDVISASISGNAVNVPNPSIEHVNLPMLSDDKRYVNRRPRVFLMAADPAHENPEQFWRGLRSIEAELSGLIGDKRMVVTTNYDRTLEGCMSTLRREEPTIIHIVGHGADDTFDSTLANRGMLKQTLAESLDASLLESVKNKVVCIFLACGTTREQESALIASVPAVVAVPRGMSDETVQQFAGSFYRALGAGRSIQSAFDQATVAIRAFDLSNPVLPDLIAKSHTDLAQTVLNENETIRLDSAKAEMTSALQVDRALVLLDSGATIADGSQLAALPNDHSTGSDVVPGSMLDKESATKLIVENLSDITHLLVARFRYNLVSRIDAEDLAQEVIFRVWSGVAKEQLIIRDKRHLLAWVKRVAQGVAIDRARAWRRLQSVEAEDARMASLIRDRITSPSASESVEWWETVADVMAPFDRSDDREILYLWFMGYRHEQVGEMLQLPINTVRSRWSRIRELLRDRMKPKRE